MLGVQETIRRQRIRLGLQSIRQDGTLSSSFVANNINLCGPLAVCASPITTVWKK